MAIDEDDNESGDTIVVRFIFDHERRAECAATWRPFTAHSN